MRWNTILALKNQEDMIWRMGKGQTSWNISDSLSSFPPKVWGCSALIREDLSEYFSNESANILAVRKLVAADR